MRNEERKNLIVLCYMYVLLTNFWTELRENYMKKYMEVEKNTILPWGKEGDARKGKKNMIWVDV